MDRYIGLDVHAASCTAAVMDARGKKLGAHVIATNGEALVSARVSFRGILTNSLELDPPASSSPSRAVTT